MADTLTFSLVPREQDITFEALLKGIEDVRKFVLAVDFAATHGKPRVWMVERLRSSTPTIAIRPDDGDTRIIDAIVSGVATITQQPDIVEPPPLFSEEALEDLKSMRRLFRSGVQRVEFSTNGTVPQLPARVSRDIGERVDRIVGAGYSALGSLEGELGAIKTHGKPYLTIWESVSGLPIRCTFPLSRVGEIKDLLQRRVRVLGRINYFRNGRPRNITEFRDIQDLTPDPQLPRARFGSIPDITGGMDSAEYLKIIRG